MTDAEKKAGSYNSRMEDLILSLGSKTKQENSSDGEGKKSGTFWIVTWLLAVILFILFTFVIENGWLSTILFGIASLILFVPAVYFGFAPKNIFFTIIEEGTAKIVLKGGEFSHAIIRWEEHGFDGQWNVSQEPAVDYIFGGLCFYGLWPFYTIYSKNFRWQDVQLIQGKEELKFHEEKLDFVLVKPAIYGTDLKEAKTIHTERIPLNVEFLVSMRVMNPYKVFFNAPPNWNEKLLARLNALLRGWIGNHPLDEILAVKGNPKDIWNDLKSGQFSDLIKDFEVNWGVKIEENGVDLRDVNYSSTEDEKAASAGKIMELEAAGVASQTVGMILASMAKSRGKSMKQIQKMIDGDADLQKEFMGIAKDLLERQMALKAGALVDVRVGGAEGLEKMLLSLLAAAQKIGSGKGSGPKSP